MSTFKYDLEDRLIGFAVMALTIAEALPYGAKSLSKQLARSGTSPALNYGEAQSAESPKDFLHKLKLCLKELRESQICLLIVKRKPFLDLEKVDPVLKECSELVAIFTTSVETKKKNIRQIKVKT